MRDALSFAADDTPAIVSLASGIASGSGLACGVDGALGDIDGRDVTATALRNGALAMAPGTVNRAAVALTVRSGNMIMRGGVRMMVSNNANVGSIRAKGAVCYGSGVLDVCKCRKCEFVVCGDGKRTVNDCRMGGSHCGTPVSITRKVCLLGKRAKGRAISTGVVIRWGFQGGMRDCFALLSAR